MSRTTVTETGPKRYVDRRGKPISELDHRLLRVIGEYSTVAETKFGEYTWNVTTKWTGHPDALFSVNTRCGILSIAEVFVDTEEQAKALHDRVAEVLKAATGPDGFRSSSPDLIEDVHKVLDKIRKAQFGVEDDPEPAEESKSEPTEKVSESEPVNLEKEPAQPEPETLKRTPASPTVPVIPAFGPTPTKKKRSWWNF